MPKIGPYKLHVIDTGRFWLDGGAMFGIIPAPLWTRRIEPDSRNRIPLQMRCLLLEGDGRLILIDNGLGHKYDSKFAEIYGVDHEHSTLLSSLNDAGFSPDEVTDVILTHLHFDHCGGSTFRQGDRLMPTFPNADHYVQRAHWSWATEPNLRERGSFLKENFEPIVSTGQMQFLDGEVSLFDGVRVRLAHGHTESQQLVMIEDDHRVLVFAADLLPTSAHLAPLWGMGYDVRPLVTIDEKVTFLDEAVDMGWIVFFEHDPVVEIAALRRGERAVEVVDTRPLVEL